MNPDLSVHEDPRRMKTTSEGIFVINNNDSKLRSTLKSDVEL